MQDIATKPDNCPQCDGPMKVRKGSKGPFLSCAKFPTCRGSRPMPQRTAPGPECNPKFRADGALALAVAMVNNWHNIKVADDKRSIAEHSVQMIDEIIEELGK